MILFLPKEYHREALEKTEQNRTFASINKSS